VKVPGGRAAISSTYGLAKDPCFCCDAFRANARYRSPRSMKVFLSSTHFANNALRSHSTALSAKSWRFRRFRRLVIRSTSRPTSRRVSSASFCQYSSESCAVIADFIRLPIIADRLAQHVCGREHDAGDKRDHAGLCPKFPLDAIPSWWRQSGEDCRAFKAALPPHHRAASSFLAVTVELCS
jgi:hypothetical protein